MNKITTMDGRASHSQRRHGSVVALTAALAALMACGRVEKQQAPETILTTSPDGTKSRLLCVHPKQVKYLGGDVNAAARYTCQ